MNNPDLENHMVQGGAPEDFELSQQVEIEHEAERNELRREEIYIEAEYGD